MNKEEIAGLFSKGSFEKTYDFVAENAEWIIVEENHFKGKEAILNQCKKVSGYFNTVTTNFNTLKVISVGRDVVITGTAEFSKDNEQLSFVSACDLYEFNDLDLIQKITSYCVQAT